MGFTWWLFYEIDHEDLELKCFRCTLCVINHFLNLFLIFSSSINLLYKFYILFFCDTQISFLWCFCFGFYIIWNMINYCLKFLKLNFDFNDLRIIGYSRGFLFLFLINLQRLFQTRIHDVKINQSYFIYT